MGVPHSGFRQEPGYGAAQLLQAWAWPFLTQSHCLSLSNANLWHLPHHWQCVAAVWSPPVLCNYTVAVPWPSFSSAGFFPAVSVQADSHQAKWWLPVSSLQSELTCIWAPFGSFAVSPGGSGELAHSHPPFQASKRPSHRLWELCRCLNSLFSSSISSNALIWLAYVCFEYHLHLSTVCQVLTWICETVEGSSFPSLHRLCFPFTLLLQKKIPGGLETPLAFWRVLSGIFPAALRSMFAKLRLPQPKISRSAVLLRLLRFIATCSILLFMQLDSFW